MQSRSIRVSHLQRIYQAYLLDVESATFVAAVARRYSTATLSRLSLSNDVVIRRASALALGMIGSVSINDVLGRMLSDADRKVRLIADDSIKSIWSRVASPRHWQQMDGLVRKLEGNQFAEAIRIADDLIVHQERVPDIFSQRAIAKYQLQDYRSAMADCHRAIELNRYHYFAWIGMGHCYLELSQPLSALDCFRRAVAIYPDLEPVRLQIRRLERAYQEPN